MKNFRKVLALILVVATLFSFTAMASAKTTADYTDGDKVNYKEAVDVLSAIGVLDGYKAADGTYSFQPTANIERDEMAKMIAVLANAGDDVSELYASALPFTDCGDGDVKWAASYIAYCAQTGIVAGRSATTFDPRANVTGLETAKMLLCVLGFDAKEQGYVGANWKINVLRDAKNVGLLDGFAAGYDVSKAITREEAANMFLNALVSPIIVGTLSNNIVKISNAMYDRNGLTDVTLIDAEKYGWVNLYGNVIVSKDLLLSIFAGLSVDFARDCYGRPGHTWSYRNSKGTVIDSVFYVNTPDLVYTTTATLGNDLQQELKNKFDLVWFLDGVAERPAGYTGFTADTLTAIAGNTGKGVRTEVYVNDHEGTVDIVIINTYIGVVDYITKQENSFTLANGLKFSNKGFNFAEGDVILYWLCGAKAEDLHGAKLAEPVTAKVTRVTTVGGVLAQSTFTADGKAYEYAKNYVGTGSVTQDPCLDVPEVGGTFDIYVDETGYVMLTRVHTDYPEVFYAYAVEGTGLMKDFGIDGTGNDIVSCTKDLVDFDAKYTKDVKVDEDVFVESVKMYLDAKKPKNGMLFSYTMAGDVVALEEVAPYQAGAQAYLTADGDLIRTNQTVYGTSATKYLVRTVDYTTGEYVYTAFTGKLDKSYVGFTYKNVAEGKTKGTIQYFVDGRGFLSYVFVDAIYAKTAVNAFVLGYSKSVSDITFVKQFGAYDAYDAVINGEKSILAVTQNDELYYDNWLYQAELACIGLTDEGVPVYSAVNALEPSTEGVAYEFYKDRMIVVAPGGLAGNVYRFAEGCKIVVAYPVSGGFDAVTLETPAEINNFLESHGSVSGNEAGSYLPGYGWIIESAPGYVSEVYFVVD